MANFNPQTNSGNRYLIALVAALGLIPIVLDTTIVNVVLTPIRQELHTDLNTAQWILSGYFLANAAVVAVGGYLASRFGRKRLFIIGLAIFTIGSALCAVAPSIDWLIAFRVFQGIGGGIILPLGPAMAFDGFPQEERAKASAMVAVPLLLAPIFGPIAGGYLNDTFDWHSIFYVNLPVGVIAILAALFVFPRDAVAANRGARFDLIGLTLSSLGIIAVLYAFSLVTRTDPSTVSATNPNGDLYGWGYWLVWTLFGVGAVLLVTLIVYSLWFTRDPALDLRQLKRRDFLVSSIFNWATALFSFGLLILLPVYFESVRQPHLSALDTGVALIPFSIGAVIGTIGSATLYRRLGPRVVVFLGALMNGGSAWLLAQVTHPTASANQLLAAMQTHTAVSAVASPADMWWGIFMVGLSISFMVISVQTLALEALSGEALAKASSLFLSTKFIFSSIGAAIITTLMVDYAHSRATDMVHQVKAQASSVGANPGDPQAAAALHALLTQIGVQAGTYAVQSIFWLVVYASIGLAIIALFLPGRRRASIPAKADEGTPQVAAV